MASLLFCIHNFSLVEFFEYLYLITSFQSDQKYYNKTKGGGFVFYNWYMLEY